jgi:hypothetical protein
MQIVTLILEDPEYIKPSGMININALAKDSNMSWNKVSEILEQIGNKIGNTLV